MTLDEAKKNIGKRVRYDPGYTHGVEWGTITKVNDLYVFVKYDRGQQIKSTAATWLDLVS